MQKKNLIILIAAFALVLLAAVGLYRTLGTGAAAGLPALNQNVEDAYGQSGGPATPDTPPQKEDPATDGASSPQDSSTPDAGETEDTPANPNTVPALDFTFYHADGSSAKLSDYFGKPIVLNFWSSNCGPCRSEMPDFQRAHEELGEAVTFLMVNVTDGYWDTVESASSYVAEEGFTFPVFYDTDNHAAYTYGVTGLPTTYLIDAAGELAAYRSGAMSYDILMSGIDLIS